MSQPIKPNKADLNDSLSITDKLIESIQVANRAYIFQDEKRSMQRTFILGLFLAVMLAVLVVFTIQRSLWHSKNTEYRDMAKEYVLQRYSIEDSGTISLGDQFSETLIKNDWPSFAEAQQGVKSIIVVTQYCDGDWLFGGKLSCDFSFQTHFNNNKFSMTYAVQIEADNDGQVSSLSVRNSTGANMLLSKPAPYTSKP
ncbi:hypothetical protein ACRZ5S_22450 (plasmid) [Vibrio scophthalmi]|uniref:hypothetical protein n=1 Tax=Vibrio scophthalmi TaxID=45658 RepID=UPI003EB85090